MKSSAKLMYGLTVFMVAMAVIYIFATMHVNDAASRALSGSAQPRSYSQLVCP